MCCGVPAVSSPVAVWDGAEQSPEPRARLPFTGGELGRFRLVMVGAARAAVPGLVQADVLGTHSGSGGKKPPSLPRVFYFETCVTTTKSVEKQTQILSSTRTNIFEVILRFVKSIQLESKILFTWLNCLNFIVTHTGSFLGYRK